MARREKAALTAMRKALCRGGSDSWKVLRASNSSGDWSSIRMPWAELSRSVSRFSARMSACRVTDQKPRPFDSGVQANGASARRRAKVAKGAPSLKASWEARSTYGSVEREKG